MERITSRDTKGHAIIPIKRLESACRNSKNPILIDIYKTPVDRLAAIEDILGDTYDLDHLRDLMTAEQEGRLYVRPPFQVGDTLYLLITTFNSYEMRETTITGFRAGKNYQYVTYRLNKPPYFESSVKVDELGKIAFLSQEEAEAALEKMKEAAEE